ncbi:MAG: hypothetical protein O2894_11795 [Planctomycetota bacterium]|nr:hypothetical protein [Planctomycetota bacterium]
MDTPTRPPADGTPEPSPAAGLEALRPAGALGDAPMREVAHAFRMNAEALHTLKEMQADLARQVRRGDRSELVVQSTQALNETFRNLTSVQQELLRRLHAAPERRGGGPLVPLMLLGLLVVLLGGIWIMLDAIERKQPQDPELAPAEVARRERDAFRQGRDAGGGHADNELRRLTDALEEARHRAGTLQSDIDAKAARISELDQSARMATAERDEFASQVRKAQSEMMAKQVLEDEVAELRLQLDAANRVTATAEHELGIQRSKNAWLRERVADYGMGFAEDDPPWRPGLPAGATPPGMAEMVSKDDPSTYSALTNMELAKRTREALGGTAPSGLPAGSLPTGSLPTGSLPTGSASDRGPGIEPAPVGPRIPVARPGGAAYGGDGPGMPPPVVLRERGAEEPSATSTERVRHHLNELLQGADASGGAGWRITSIKGVSPDRLSGVVMVRYLAGGRIAESVEAREVGITLTSAQREVEFAFRDGERLVGGQRMRLPAVGSRVTVVQGGDVSAWNASPLRIIQKR